MRARLTCAVLLGGLAGVIAAPVPKADPLAPPTAKELKTSVNNLKQIGLGIISYSDTFAGRMPTDITDKDGKPLLSWRVEILPYIEQQDLYKEFKLDEPWDSEHNKKLIAKLPTIYAPIRVKAKAGETFYQVFTGEKALFGPKQNPKYPASIPDGTSNTALVVEAGEPVIWTKPADVPFDEKKALPKLGGMFDGDFHVVLCDGSVALLKKNPDEKEMKKLITPADGFTLDLDKLKK
ncbi:MAG: DUF1559 domain-containing protein [Planctomycetia bacterium]|nr:DUF1559 domain-containing protein [Planctomycetia bacterium]